MENTTNTNANDEMKGGGWSTVNITPDMPLSMIIQFMNVLNQRLCFIEDNQKVQINEGQVVTITELMKMQEEEAKRAAAQSPQEEQK